MEWTAETPPTARDIAAYYRQEIATGNLTPSRQLPASRRLAAKLHVATMTVQSAYAQLAGEGLVDTRQGSGTFVREAERGAPSAQETALGLRELQTQLQRVTSQLAELSDRVGALEGSVPERREMERLLEVGEAGTAGAMLNLGKLLADEGDLEGARTWWTRAAEAGDPAAMNNLGKLLADEGDLEGARAWLTRAVEAGSSDPHSAGPSRSVANSPLKS